jgi:2-polyprenyl-6-methoxyphenol hydroxylase-like FAD-dependent oxidoreductase
MKKIIICVLILLLWSIFPLFAVSEKPISVLVIGGGPAGLATAIEARENGATAIIIEKRKTYSRAQLIFLLDSSIKLLEKWKVDVPEMAVIDFGNKGKFGFVSINRLEEALARRANELEIEIVHGEFHRLDQKQAIIKTSDFQIPLPYNVLVAADGMHSRVREELDISYKRFGKASGIATLMVFHESPGEFEISPTIEKNGFFARKITVPQASIIFAQSSTIEKISSKEFEELVRECSWEREAEMIAESKMEIFLNGIEIILQQADTFSSKKKSAILVGDAAATASFFRGMGANTAFKTASIAGEFFKKLKQHDENAFRFFNQKMKEATDSLIEDSQFLFPSELDL